MKILAKASLSIMVLLLLASAVSARSKKDFDKFLKSTTDNVTNYNSDKYYEKLEFLNKQTNEKKKYSDFEEADRFVFKLIRIDVLSREMEELYNAWKEELKNAEEAPDDENEANKKDVQQYLDKLLELRKKNAETVEAMTAELFKTWPTKFPKEEQEYVLKAVKEYHDKSNLIKRK